MTCRSPVRARKAADSSMARLAVMPFRVWSRSGSSSMIRSVSMPNRSTSRAAVAGPTPLRMPEPRYAAMSASSRGIRRSTLSAVSCGP